MQRGARGCEHTRASTPPRKPQSSPRAPPPPLSPPRTPPRTPPESSSLEAPALDARAGLAAAGLAARTALERRAGALFGRGRRPLLAGTIVVVRVRGAVALVALLVAVLVRLLPIFLLCPPLRSPGGQRIEPASAARAAGSLGFRRGGGSRGKGRAGPRPRRNPFPPRTGSPRPSRRRSPRSTR